MSQTTKEGTTVSQNGTPYIIGTPKSGKLHSFDMVLTKTRSEIPRVIIATLSDYTLWHRRLGHAHQRVIKHLGKNMEGGPNQTTKVPDGACEGCEKEKSKRLPFPSSRSRVSKPLDLVHSDLDKMPVLSIGGYKYTAIYLDDHSSFGVMFYLKHKNKEFAAFKTYKAWAEWHKAKMQVNRSWGRVHVKRAKGLFGRKQNRTSNVHARFSATKWMSGKVPTNHHKWS